MAGFNLKKFIAFWLFFAIIIYVVFTGIWLFFHFTMLDYSFMGFPLKFSESWGPCPMGMTCHSENPLNFYLDILIAIIIALIPAYFFSRRSK